MSKQIQYEDGSWSREMISTVTLTEFLLARIAEDEQQAAAAGHGCGYLHEHNAGWLEVTLPDKHNARPAYDMRFIRDHSPARVLAECEAKRRIVGTAHYYDSEAATSENAWAHVLQYLALPYADHPDYRESWRA